MRDSKEKKRSYSAGVRDTTVFAMLGALMFASKIAFETLPNIHLVGMLTIVYTSVYRTRALIPIYIFVIMTGVYAGFSYWWVPYLYIWAILWGFTMLLPKRMPRKIGAVVYPVICALFGLLYGTLYAPAQAIMFGLDFEQMLLWIAAGLSFDIIHAVGNFAAGFLVIPLSELLGKLDKKYGR